MISANVLQEFEQVSVSFVDEDGYPVTVPAKVRIEDGRVTVELPEGFKGLTFAGRKVNVTFNHITPIPGGGYTDRRYLMIRGTARPAPEGIEVDVEKSYRWDEKEVPFPEYVEVSSVRARRYLERLGLRLGLDFKPRIGAFWAFFRVVRLPFLIATAVPTAIGASVAYYNGFFDPLLLLLTFVGLAFIHLGLNVANDYFDTKLGADPANRRPTPFSGGSRAIIYGLISESESRTLFASFFAAGSAIGMYLAITRGPLVILGLMALGLFLAYFYTAPPIKLAYRGMGELAVGTGFGPVIVLGAYFVQTQKLTLDALLASIPIGILIMLILYVNEIPDAPFDKVAGKMHLVTRISKENALRLLAVFYAAAYASTALIPVLRLGPPTVLIALVTIPTAVRVYRMVSGTFGIQYAMIPAMALNIRN
ncbi:MAG: prenyltransferase, partial [Aigarchaeota archaeon]|nr:prenyltransferase [Aigarchaeota archaeon]